MTNTATTPSLPTPEDIGTWRINPIYLSRRFPTAQGLVPLFVEDYLLFPGDILASLAEQGHNPLPLEDLVVFTLEGLAPRPPSKPQPLVPPLTEAETIELKLWRLDAVERAERGEDLDFGEWWQVFSAYMVHHKPGGSAPGPSVADVD
ncbi:uncharacterized protein LOC62_07G008898 [Vanrija pseudolonga]|uniref:Uncharacterized protein n=1 Tax=Vanrija pseudolonga TaxID=143232 RepID=A0AAF0YEM5_9TREE|nr:hypothetical protein LOC62_07G008898 [Vanrija pseudolonga]